MTSEGEIQAHRRRMFAAAALDGMLSCDSPTIDRKDKATWARIAFDWADAMMVEDGRRAMVIPTPAETCLCAAVLVNGQIIRGHRHDDALQTAGKKGLGMKACVQGFLTSRGRFVDRREGMALQVAAGIESITGYRGDTLFSEDLY